MRIIIKKPKWSLLISIKLVFVAILTHLFGIGWGLLAIAVIDSLPSIKINRTM